MKYKMSYFVVAALMTLLPALTSTAQVYKWVDDNGKVHYSDSRPQNDTQTLQIKGTISSYAPKAVSGRADEPAPQAQTARSTRLAKNGEVVIFTTASCGYCKMAKRYFKSHQIPYREMKVDTSAQANKLFQQLGGRGVPLTVIGRVNSEQKISGFSEAKFDQLFKDS